MRQGGIGVIEEGKFKGKKFLIPNEVLVEKLGVLGPSFAKACLIHQEFIPDQGCPECKKETNGN